MRKEYDKLVRDRIPEIIRRGGRQCGVEVMPEGKYIQALKDKLIEEAKEAATTGADDLVKELADLYEVMDALMAACGIVARTCWTSRENAAKAVAGSNGVFVFCGLIDCLEGCERKSCSELLHYRSPHDGDAVETIYTTRRRKGL